MRKSAPTRLWERFAPLAAGINEQVGRYWQGQRARRIVKARALATVRAKAAKAAERAAARQARRK
jgi:hypothetical protein